MAGLILLLIDLRACAIMMKMNDRTAVGAWHRRLVVIKDVAARAGVSTGSISKYFSNPSGLREGNRLRIEQAVRELDYRPSRIARSLRTQRTNLLALVVPDIVNPFYASVYDAVRISAAPYGYKPILYTTEDDLKILKDYLEGDDIHEVDGIIFCFMNEDEILADFQKIRSRIPLVLLSWDMDARTDSVVIDLFDAIKKSTNHLLELGHRKIAYIGGPPDSRISKEKMRGYEKALSDAGCQLRPEYVFMGRYRLHTGYQATQQFLRLTDPPTAIVAANDTLGIGSMKYLLQHRIRIPENVAVIGLDNVPLSAMYEPALSTVTIPIERMGLEAVKMLMNRIQKPQSRSRNILLGTELVIRSSTDKASPVVTEL
jgi:DNA-binding LacI/PurR family transcriptional regulator